MKIEEGKSYRGGTTIQADRVKKVLVIDRRASGMKYVKWINIKKDGREGATGWMMLDRFQQWARKVEE
jgi:hypothetical protein